MAALRLFAIPIVALLASCSSPKAPLPPPPIGRQMRPIDQESDPRFRSGPPGSGFGDVCSIFLRDSVTGAEYLLVRSSVARAASKMPQADSGAVVVAVGEYAPRPADTVSEPPKGQFHLDCLKSQVIPPSDLLAPNTR
jgi:hypothetical protein